MRDACQSAVEVCRDHERNRASKNLGLNLLLAALSLFSFALMPACSRASERDSTAYIRVNQVGYESGLPMRAYLMTETVPTGATFSVKKSDGAVVSSGAIGASGGAWGDYAVYPLDFTVATAGTYTLTVSGPIEASSPNFTVDTPAQLYSTSLSNALQFFQNQRDGNDYVPSRLRTAPAHLNDQKANVYRSPEFSGSGRIKGNLVSTGAVVDVSGGWWDAGDYLKFVHTTSYTEALMLVGVRDFPRQMGADSSTSKFAKEAKFGLDWLQRMWNDNSATLYYQVGIGSGISGFENDHNIWRLPQEDDSLGGTNPKFQYIRNRPVLIAAPAGSKISPNLAGRLAADFALGSIVYRTSDPAYAAKCLLAAEHVFDLADTSPSGKLLTASPYDFYGESEWRDDLELGATELYLATHSGNLPATMPHRDPAFYLKAAADWASAYIHNKKDAGEILDLGDVSGLAHFELYRAITLAGNSNGLAVTQTDLLKNMKSALDSAAVRAGKDPFRFGASWGGGDTPSHGAALAVMASEYDYLTKSHDYDAYTGDGSTTSWVRMRGEPRSSSATAALSRDAFITRWPTCWDRTTRPRPSWQARWSKGQSKGRNRAHRKERRRVQRMAGMSSRNSTGTALCTETMSGSMPPWNPRLISQRRRS